MRSWLGARARQGVTAYRQVNARVDAFWGTGEATEAEIADRFPTWVARVIVAVTIFGAVVSYQASRAAGAADGADQQALRESNYEELDRTTIRSTVAYQLRMLGEFEQSWYEDSLLGGELQADPGSQELKLAQLRALRSHQLVQGYVFGGLRFDEQGNPTFDPDEVSASAAAHDPTLNELRPEKSAETADQEHDRAVALVRAAALLAAALFLLTLATLTARRLGVRIAILGGVAIVLGVIQFLIA